MEIEVVFDLLDEEHHHLVLHALEAERYRLAVKGVSIWQGQADPMEGIQKYLWLAPTSANSHLKQLPGVKMIEKGTSLDVLVQSVRSSARDAFEVVGQESRDWHGILLIPYVYHAGSQSIWHHDGVIYTGAFVYYAHKRWLSEWGGALEYRTASETVSLLPKKNSLCLIHPSVYHRVAEVAPEAPHRMSVAGFFLKDDADSIRAMIKNERLV